MNPIRWIILAAILALLAVTGVQELRIAHLKTDWAQEKTDIARGHLKSVEQAATTSRALVDAGAKRGKKDAQDLATLAADRDRLERLLRDRPYRPEPGVPGTSSSAGGGGAGATGSGLYREDGEFLAGEAASAKRIAIERDSCLAQYHEAERLLSGKAGK